MLIKYISQAYNILNLEVLDDHHDTSFAIVIIKILSRNLQNFSVIVIELSLAPLMLTKI